MIERAQERFLFASRRLLAQFYVGLVFTLVGSGIVLGLTDRISESGHMAAKVPKEFTGGL